MKGKSLGTLYVLICVSLWGLIPVVARIGQSQLDNHQFLFWSSLVSFLVLAGNAGFTGRLREVRTYAPGEWLFILFLSRCSLSRSICPALILFLSSFWHLSQ